MWLVVVVSEGVVRVKRFWEDTIIVIREIMMGLLHELIGAE